MSDGELKKRIYKVIIEVQKEQADFDCLDYSYKTDVVIDEAKKDLYENSYRETEDEIKVDYKTWIKWFGDST